MKNISTEPDVDFIGNQEPLTKEQEDILKECLSGVAVPHNSY